jgi:hypothetical protein
MSIQRTEENGGTFSAPLAADVRLTFIPVKPAANKRARKLELTGSFTFPASPLPWSFAAEPRTKRTGSVLVDTDGDLVPDTPLPGTSNFSALQSAGRAGLKGLPWEPCHCVIGDPICHMDGGKEHCSQPQCPYCCMSCSYM